MEVGKHIRMYRNKKGITLKELGKIVGVSPQAISQYERSEREPSFEILEKIAAALDVDTFDLMGAIKFQGNTTNEILESINNNTDLPLNIKEDIKTVFKGGTLKRKSYTPEEIPYEDALESIMILTEYSKPDILLQISDYKEILNDTVDYIKYKIYKLKLNEGLIYEKKQKEK